MGDKHRGSLFDDFLIEEGIFEEVTRVAVKRVIAWQLSQTRKGSNISKPASTLRSYIMPNGEHMAMELNCPGWIKSLVENKDEIQAKQAVRNEFEKLVEGYELPLPEETIRDSWLHGDCREFRRLSLFVKYHSTYRVSQGGMGLCSKSHWLAAWCVLPGHFQDEIEIAKQVARDFDRRYPELGIMSLPAEWWQI